MVSADGHPTFEPAFIERTSRPEPASDDARFAAPHAAPEAKNAVNQLADSFRQILLRAVETDPSQLQMLTEMVSTMGLQVGDGASQQEIDKMAKSLSNLSVAKQPQGVQHRSVRKKGHVLH
jgi:hypothetical protein